MFLSCLEVNVGSDSNREDCRIARNWLRNLYHVHQRLCMAFPTTHQLEKDPDFLKPYQPCGFLDPRPVHVPRDIEHNFLFRIDPLASGRVAILVQSAGKEQPNWAYAFQNADYLLAALPQVKQFDPVSYQEGAYRFRLVANPTMKFDTLTKKERLKYTKEEFKAIKGRNGKRLPVPSCQLSDWLSHKGEKSGFSISQDSLDINVGFIYFQKREEDHRRLRSVCYNGILKVTDRQAFMKTIESGIGSGKAFGFGLLSVARG
jgi:CRISPR system Cascade subunit CasE